MLLKFFNAKKDKKYFEYDKKNYDSFLDDPLCQAGRNINRFLRILVILSVVSLSLETVRDNFTRFYDEFFIVNMLISSIFAIEYIYRFIKSKKKSKFPFSFFNVIDILSFLPFFIQIIFTNTFWVNFLNALRLIRILRLVDFVKQTPLILWFARSVRDYEKEYKVAFSLMWIVLILVSIIVYFFESPYNPEFSSIPNAIWWGVVTMATVWYGDIYPITPLWKIFGSLIIILGPLLIAIVSSITILIFMNFIEMQRNMKQILDILLTCNHCKSWNPKDSNYCCKCWAELHHKEKKKVAKKVSKKNIEIIPM